MVTLCFALALTEMQPVRGWALTPAVLGAGLVAPSELNTMDQQNALVPVTGRNKLAKSCFRACCRLRF